MEPGRRAVTEVILLERIPEGKITVKIVRFIIILSLIALVSGCVAGKREPSNTQGNEPAVSMDQAITEYLENNVIPLPPPTGVRTFAAYDLFGVSENGNEKKAYLWALITTYGVDPNIGIGPRSGSSLPLALILKEENGSFTVVGHRQPGDGAYYWPDVKEIFPKEYHEKILNYQKSGKIKELEQSIKENVNNYLMSVGLKNTP